MDKFAEYYNSEKRISELSEYVHMNFKLIQTKMVSELRRNLNITPDMQNTDGYVSLMVSLYGRMFNEMVYGLAGICQSTKVKAWEILPKTTILILFDLLEGKNPLGGRLRQDVSDDLAKFQSYYLKEIRSLRECIEALPQTK